MSLEHYLFVEETLLKITDFFVPGSLLKVLKRKWTKTNHEFFMYRNLEFFWVFCTQNLYRVPAVEKCFGQILAMLLLSLHLYSSCFSAVSRFCRIWSNLERDDWLDLENRFPQQFCHQQGKGGVCHQTIFLFFLIFFYFHLFWPCFFFFACILGGLAIKLIDIYCGYFLVSSLSLTEEKSAINFS